MASECICQADQPSEFHVFLEVSSLCNHVAVWNNLRFNIGKTKWELKAKFTEDAVRLYSNNSEILSLTWW